MYLPRACAHPSDTRLIDDARPRVISIIRPINPYLLTLWKLGHHSEYYLYGRGTISISGRSNPYEPRSHIHQARPPLYHCLFLSSQDHMPISTRKSAVTCQWAGTDLDHPRQSTYRVPILGHISIRLGDTYRTPLHHPVDQSLRCTGVIRLSTISPLSPRSHVFRSYYNVQWYPNRSGHCPLSLVSLDYGSSPGPSQATRAPRIQPRLDLCDASLQYLTLSVSSLSRTYVDRVYYLGTYMHRLVYAGSDSISREAVLKMRSPTYSTARAARVRLPQKCAKL